MLPYWAKLIWMIGCTTGTVVSWFVMWAFAKAINSWWVPMTYCAALTVMVLDFDLGVIWHMNPSAMPKYFCITQMAVLNLSAFVLLGVCSSFNLATTISVLWPTQYSSPHATLQWRNSYLILLVVIPIISTVLEVYFAVSLNAYPRPGDGFDTTLCDVTEPLWPKLLGYGALPLLQSIPSMGLALFVVARISRMHKAHRQLWRQVADDQYCNNTFDTTPVQLTSPSRTSVQNEHDRNTSPTNSSLNLSSLVKPISPPGLELDSPVEPDTPFKSPTETTSFRKAFSSPRQSRYIDEGHSPELPTFSLPEEDHQQFAEKGILAFDADRQDKRTTPCGLFTVGCSKDRGNAASKLRRPPSLHLAPDRSEPDGSATEETENTFQPKYQSGLVSSCQQNIPLRRAQSLASMSPQTLFAQIWRLLLFQVTFFIIVALLAVSTWKSMITHGPPREFGSDHVAGILTAWAPVLVFAHSPGVRAKMAFWRKP